MKGKTILPGHGSGGRLMNDMIDSVIRKRLGPDSIQLDDSAILDLPASKIAFTTDSFTVTPIFFPGGDIGSLAVNGTVNDLSVMGARPLYLSCSLILEEGLDFSELETILDSMRKAADGAGVTIVTGDTKVVPHGKGDRVFINTSGIGVFDAPPARSPIAPGDAIIASGTLGDHGMTIMALRNNLRVSGALRSDCAPLNRLTGGLASRFPGAVRFMRDATRGGAAAVLNEIVKGAPFGARVDEESVPVSGEVRGICAMLGMDPMYVANEGKLIVVADAASSGAMVEFMRADPLGRDAAVIGAIDTEFPGRVYLKTGVGGRRILPLLTEEQLPRIC